MLMNKDGFTLIEMLFVLLIVCMISSLSLAIRIPHKTDTICIQEISHFFYNAKLDAMIYKEQILIDINNQIISYTVNEKSVHYQLSEGMYFDNHHFSFNEYGHIQGAKSLTFHGSSHDYTFVFQVGSGSFYVE